MDKNKTPKVKAIHSINILCMVMDDGSTEHTQFKRADAIISFKEPLTVDKLNELSDGEKPITVVLDNLLPFFKTECDVYPIIDPRKEQP
jgi:hypothetical protein